MIFYKERYLIYLSYHIFVPRGKETNYIGLYFIKLKLFRKQVQRGRKFHSLKMS